MNNEIEREITALREQLAAVSKERDAMLPDYELEQAMRKNYDAAKVMKPLGIRPVRFPAKTKEWLGKNVRMWWEELVTPNKKRDRQRAKKELK